MEGEDRSSEVMFNAHQRATIEAATARIVPADHEPGAREAGVIDYIQRLLMAQNSEEKLTPWEKKEVANFLLASVSGRTEEQQRTLLGLRDGGPETCRLYHEGVQELDKLAKERFGGTEFRSLEPSRQDEILAALEQGGGRFFTLLVRHTMEGFYGDPRHGGNRNRVGWTVLGFPGPSFPNGYSPPLGWYDANVPRESSEKKKSGQE